MSQPFPLQLKYIKDVEPLVKAKKSGGHRIAVMSDIHGNIHALDAALRHAMENGGFDQLVVPGDIIGYGGNPNEVIDRLRKIEASGIPVHATMGNHEAAVSGKLSSNGTGDTVQETFNPYASDAIDRTREALTAANRKWVKALPPLARVQFPGVSHGSFAVAHGTVGDPIEEYSHDPHSKSGSTPPFQFGALDDRRIRADHIINGHTHIPNVEVLSPTGAVPTADDIEDGNEYGYAPGFYTRTTMKIQPDKPISSTHRGASVAKGERMVINPGSVGQPRDNNPLASYSVIHSDGQKGLDVTNHRVGYDIAGAQDAMQSAGMHSRLVDRIRNGT